MDLQWFATHVAGKLYHSQVTQLHAAEYGFESPYPAAPRMYGARARRSIGE